MGKCCEEISYACPLQKFDDSGDSNRPRLRTHGIYIPLQEYAQWENSINPGFLNSDIVENLFGQQRGVRNGLNNNPTLAQYGPSNTAIILGQCTMANKSISTNKASFFTATTPCPLNITRNKSQRALRRGIRL